MLVELTVIVVEAVTVEVGAPSYLAIEQAAKLDRIMLVDLEYWPGTTTSTEEVAKHTTIITSIAIKELVVRTVIEEDNLEQLVIEEAFAVASLLASIDFTVQLEAFMVVTDRLTAYFFLKFEYYNLIRIMDLEYILSQ
jgi:hypothetical protein